MGNGPPAQRGRRANDGRQRRQRQSRPLFNHGACWRAPLDADDVFMVEDQLVDDEAFTNLGAGIGGGVNQQFVENRAPWTKRDGSVGGSRRAGED